MKRSAVVLVVLALLLAVPGGASDASDVRTLTGEWLWNHRDNRGSLEAVFTPTGEGTWDVAFHFTFRGQPHVYSGTAEGSLTEGLLEGKVLNEDKERTFTFTGSFKDGRFKGTHAEIEDGRAHDTGTLTMQG